MSCPLCEIKLEEIHYRDDQITIADTLNKKGHKERIMVLSNAHVETVPKWVEEHGLEKLRKIGKRLFGYTYKFVILSPLYGTIQDHWHYVASAIDPNAEDFEQMLGTPWMEVVEVKLWRE